MKYICKSCNYESCDKSNYNRHLKSASHLQVNSSINTELTVKVNLDRPSNFQCPKCAKTFTTAPGLSRHKNKYCKIDEIKEQFRDELKDELKKEFEIEYQNKIIQKMEKEIDQLKQHVHNSKPTTTYNISIKKMIQQSYPDAPHLEKLDDYAILHDDDTDLMQDLIDYHIINKLNKYFGDIIIKFYKKDDPKEQSVWSTDSSRLKYIIKELIATNNSYWSEDNKGLKINTYIIEPLLKYIHEYINNKINALHKDIKKSKGFDCIELSQKQIYLTAIREQIRNGSLKESIIKYIAPFFRFKTGADNLLKND